MKYIDIVDSKRVDRHPDKIIQVVSDGTTVEKGYKIKNVQLRLYTEKNDEKLGPYSLITSFIETDKGSVEMIYDEGFRGNDALETSGKFLTENLGISSLILRSLIFLDGKWQTLHIIKNYLQMTKNQFVPCVTKNHFTIVQWTMIITALNMF